MEARPLKVLLAEDNADHSELIVSALNAKDEDFQVDVCRNKKDFFERINRVTYDALLVDYHLPDGDGLEILEHLITDDFKIPVIFISGADNEEIITRTLHAGAADFVIKSRTSLKTLPIIIKRNIIRRMSRDEAQTKVQYLPLKTSSLYDHLYHSLKSIVRMSLKTTRLISRGGHWKMNVEELSRLEDLLEKTHQIIAGIRKARSSELTQKKKRRASHDQQPSA